MLVLAIVSLGVPLALSLAARVNAEVRSQAQGQADLVAATASDLLAPTSGRELEALAQTAGHSVRGRVIIVDHTGRILADSAGPSGIGASYEQRPEVNRALSGRQVQVQRHSRTLGQAILATAVPITRRGAVVGAVRITQSVSAAHSAVRRTILGIGLIGLIVLTLGLSAGALIAGQFARPLRRLERVARRIAGGDLSARAAVEGSSEQRSLGESFNEMADRVARLMTSQRDFVADASHQLRTPLTGLRLGLEEARATAVGEAAAHELDVALTEVDKLAHIIDELLLLSRAGERELPGELVDLRQISVNAVERWRKAAEEHQITLRQMGTDAPAKVWCARVDAERALDALIENALQYAPNGSVVTLANSHTSLAVLDDGPGVAEDERELVFERFHRGRASRGGPSGTGLGLPIARELAREWNGDVTLENRPDGGTIATLHLQERP